MSNNDIEKFCKAFINFEEHGQYSWKILDEALYYIFKKYPEHIVKDKVISKVALVNRAYRANLHFAGKENIETVIAKKFVKHKLDDVLSPLNEMNSLTHETLPVLLDVHGRIVTIVKKVTEKTNNSFVSKYMHFHFPDIVPIFDKYAYEESWRLVPHAKKEYSKYDDFINYDYAFHCESLVVLINKLKASGVDAPSLKNIDILLYEGID